MQSYGDFVLFAANAYGARRPEPGALWCQYSMTVTQPGPIQPAMGWWLSPVLPSEQVSPLRDASMVALGRLTAASPYWWGAFVIVRICGDDPGMTVGNAVVLEQWEQPCVPRQLATPYTPSSALCPEGIV